MIFIKYQLYKEVDNNLTPTQQVLFNRGIKVEDQQTWLTADWQNTYDWTDLDDDDKMQKACHLLAQVIDNDGRVQVLTDSDCDGYTSAAIIINYLYNRMPEWAEKNLDYILHDGKQHGLSDVMDKIDCDLVIVPDAASNDWQQQIELTVKRNIQVIILDHHGINNIETVDSTPAIVINVQNSVYPNKSLTGAGVTYRFISAYEDLILHGNQPSEFMDLCALGNCGDMASLLQLETRAIVNIGFSNIKNPFLYELCQKHKFTLDKRGGINYLSMAFAAVPFINALTRSGTPEEQETVFKSMLSQYAFQKVPSSKRGDKTEVYLYQEAVTVAERVKRRQDKLTNETMEILEEKIAEQHLTDNAIIIALCQPDEVETNICGLSANKIQAKYQHPTLVLRKTKTKDSVEYFYNGSGRNYSYCPIEDMRGLCESTGLVEYAQGQIVAL